MKLNLIRSGNCIHNDTLWRIHTLLCLFIPNENHFSWQLWGATMINHISSSSVSKIENRISYDSFTLEVEIISKIVDTQRYEWIIQKIPSKPLKENEMNWFWNTYNSNLNFPQIDRSPSDWKNKITWKHQTFTFLSWIWSFSAFKFSKISIKIYVVFDFGKSTHLISSQHRRAACNQNSKHVHMTIQN